MAANGDDSEIGPRPVDLDNMKSQQIQSHPKRWSHRFIWMCVFILTSSVHALPTQPKESNYTLEIEPFAKHTGTNAMDVTYAPDGSGRVFVSTQSGQVFVYSPDGNERGVFLDLTQADANFRFDEKSRFPFRGLMYIAFHPDYATPNTPGFGRFYTGYQVALSQKTADFDSKDYGALGDSDKRFVLAEWRVDPDNPDRIASPSYRRVLLFNFHTYANNPHALGKIAFNPLAKPGEDDYGNLYIAVGDSHNGDYNRPYNLDRAQQTYNPFAKILRIDPLPDGDQPYSVPKDNPFRMNGDTHSRRSTVYATGLRDAQWFSFAKDLEGKTVLVACDIGALKVEEINVIRLGANYGWPRFEGTLDFETKQELIGDARPPVVQYGRAFAKRVGDEPTGGGMVAIMGGLVVSDPNDPSFQGQILFGDLPNGTLMHANYHHALTMEQSGRQSTPYILSVKLGEKTGNFADVLESERGDARFGFDETKRVYIVSKRSDTIFKTKLVHTVEPVKSRPTVNPSKQLDRLAGTTGLLLTIGATGLCLAVILALVLINAKRPKV